MEGRERLLQLCDPSIVPRMLLVSRIPPDRNWVENGEPVENASTVMDTHENVQREFEDLQRIDFDAEIHRHLAEVSAEA